MILRQAFGLLIGFALSCSFATCPLTAIGQIKLLPAIDVGSGGRLAYVPDAAGNRILDYSHCGFRGGNAIIPNVQAKVVVDAVQGDATESIQQAIDYVSDLPLNAAGIRGAVLLGPGEFHVSGQLTIRRSGVVLRGAASPKTTLNATGLDRRSMIRISGSGEPRLGKEIQVTNDFVPVGATQLKLADKIPWQVGSDVLITHPSTMAWIASIGMNRFPTDDKGSWLDWKARSMDMRWERTIQKIDGQKIDGNSISFEVPLTCSIDSKLTQATVRSFEWPERIECVGVESLKLVSISKSKNPKDEEHAWDAIGIEKARDVWVRDVETVGFVGSTVSILETAKCISVIRCNSTAPISEHAAWRRRSFYTCAQQTLFQSCKADSGRNDFTVGYLATGPNVFVDCTATNAQSFSGPIESWATGVLYDNVHIDGGGLSLTNREIDGQGIGWTTANSMLWQCTAPIITCRNPPGHQNWAIGCWAGFVGDGNWKSMNEFVKPESLYRAQLAERMPPSASQRIVAADPVHTALNEIASDEKLRFVGWKSSRQPPDSKPVFKPISNRNGWLCIGDRLVSGSRLGTMWWRGSMLPSRTSEFGVGITRFTPGRTGNGFTDDLNDLTDQMVENNQAVLEHHWGLWYDRRRDDHEMIRRLDGEVWAPFYEQPWARSGQELAWDGLSKYDLESFNPWYFSRLREFASQCDAKGRILLHQMYFQHNILEAGAHWADFPWRSANCLQGVGFMEPPPYANRKRIFQADEFYDVTHPVRRSLHIAYIRQCLSNMQGQSNVVFSLGEEFTGPSAFVRFWLETIADWKKDNANASPMICLSCTKDVQDEILADPRLNPLVQVIELKYWWYFADGALYAPPGGSNLAPRQQLREWKGKKSRSDSQTARQIHELRERYPEKVIVSQTPTQNSWATIASGGSIPTRIPKMPESVAAAISQLAPMKSMGANQFGLANAGKQYLIYRIDEDGSSAARFQLPLAPFDKEYSGQWLDTTNGAVIRNFRVEKGRDLDEPPLGSGNHLLWLEAR